MSANIQHMVNLAEEIKFYIFLASKMKFQAGSWMLYWYKITW